MLFKILHGDDSRISTDVTPFHEGYVYMTHGGCLYADINIGTKESPNNKRIKLNAQNAETLSGLSLDELKAQLTTQADWNQTDPTQPDYIKNKPQIGGGLSASVIDAVLKLEQISNTYRAAIDNNILTLS